jgi:hypothetical protein
MGKPIFFLRSKGTAIGDYECLFSEYGKYVVSIKTKLKKETTKAYFIRAPVWRQIIKTTPKVLSNSFTFSVMRKHYVLAQRVVFHKNKFTEMKYGKENL